MASSTNAVTPINTLVFKDDLSEHWTKTTPLSQQQREIADIMRSNLQSVKEIPPTTRLDVKNRLSINDFATPSFDLLKPRYDWMKLALRLALAALGLLLVHQAKLSPEMMGPAMIAGSCTSLPATALALGGHFAYSGLSVLISSIASDSLSACASGLGVLACGSILIFKHETLPQIGLVELLYRAVKN